MFYLRMLPLVLFVFLIISGADGQIEMKKETPSVSVGKVKSAGAFVAEMVYHLVDNDTLYTVLFNNMTYKTIDDYQSFSFMNTGNTVTQFYDILKSFFSDEHKKDKSYNVSFKLGDQDIHALNYRVLGVTQVWVQSPKGYFLLGDNQVDKLFGKQ